MGLPPLTFRDPPDGNVYLVFMPLAARDDRQLYLHIQEVLLASNAISVVHKRE